MKERIQVDPALFEDMVAFYGEFFHVPPLAAKIHSYLIFDLARTGVTFDELVEALGASKSTVSTSLHLLISNELVHEKIEGRKRRFFINHEFTRIRFEQLLGRLKRELSLLERLGEHFKSQDFTPLDKFYVYQEMLNNSINNIDNSLSKI